MSVQDLAVNHLLARMKEIEETTLNHPPTDYVQFMTIVGQYREVKLLLKTILDAMKGLEDDEDL